MGYVSYHTGSDSCQRVNSGTGCAALNSTTIRLTDTVFFGKLLLCHIALDPGVDHCANSFVFGAQLLILGGEFGISNIALQVFIIKAFLLFGLLLCALKEILQQISGLALKQFADSLNGFPRD